MTPQEFAAKIRTKYPDGIASDGRKYSEIPDEELVQKVVARFPVYKSQIKFSQAPAVEMTTFAGRQVPKDNASFLEKLKRVPGELYDVGNRLTSGVGEHIVAAIGGKQAVEQEEKLQAADREYVTTILSLRKQAEAEGKDTAHFDQLIRNYTPRDSKVALEELFPTLKKSNEQVAGDFAALATTVLGLSAPVSGVSANSFKLAPSAISAAEGVGQGIIQGAKVGAQQGAIVGAGAGLTSGLRNEGDVGDVAFSTVAGAGIGGIAGGVLGGTVGAIAAKPKPAHINQNEYSLELTAPKLKPKEVQAAFEQGRVSEPGLLRASKIAPSQRDYMVAESVDDVVSPKASVAENIDAIRFKVAQVNQGVREMIAQRPVPFNEAQLRSRLNAGSDDLKLIFASDANAEKTYNAVVDAFMKTVHKKDTLGLFQARQSFDQIPAIKKLLETEGLGENVRREIVLAVRRSANEYISSLLPANNPYRPLLAQESRMLEALSNIAEKNIKTLGQNQLQILTDEYPVLKWVIGGLAAGLTGAAGVGVGSTIIGSTD